METRGSMFSEETLLHHSMSEEGTQVYSFQCKNKQEGKRQFVQKETL